jgi:hypothetical protein
MIFAAITRLLAAVGLSDRLSARLAPWVAGAAAIALVASVMALAVHWVGRSAVKADRAKANVEALERKAKASERAADQRLIDHRVNREQEKAYEDAIERPLVGDSDDPGVRLACERLRRAGKDTSDVPGCGGR